jgi:hypothetical protein
MGSVSFIGVQDVTKLLLFGPLARITLIPRLQINSLEHWTMLLSNNFKFSFKIYGLKRIEIVSCEAYLMICMACAIL